MRHLTLAIIAIVLLVPCWLDAQDVPRPDPDRLRPKPCEEITRLYLEMQIRAEYAESAYQALDRQWLELPADVKALASLKYEVARLMWENGQLRERNADLAGFQISAEALGAEAFTAHYNVLLKRVGECDRAESDTAFKTWLQTQPLEMWRLRR